MHIGDILISAIELLSSINAIELLTWTQKSSLISRILIFLNKKLQDDYEII